MWVGGALAVRTALHSWELAGSVSEPWGQSTFVEVVYPHRNHSGPFYVASVRCNFVATYLACPCLGGPSAPGRADGTFRPFAPAVSHKSLLIKGAPARYKCAPRLRMGTYTLYLNQGPTCAWKCCSSLLLPCSDVGYEPWRLYHAPGTNGVD